MDNNTFNSRLKPSDFNRKAEFGDLKSVKNPNTGGYKKEFVKRFSLWFATRTRTISQQVSLVGTEWENTKVIVTHHKEEIEDIQLVKIGKAIYDVVSYSPDESNKYIAYDYITLKRRS